MRPSVAQVHLINRAALRAHEGRQFRQQHAADGGEIALSLEHVGKPGEVGLEPILLGILIGRGAQVLNHRVDIVFELHDLAARVDLDLASQIAFSDRGGDVGDGAHLCGQVSGEQIYVIG